MAIFSSIDVLQVNVLQWMLVLPMMGMVMIRVVVMVVVIIMK